MFAFGFTSSVSTIAPVTARRYQRPPVGFRNQQLCYIQVGIASSYPTVSKKSVENKFTSVQAEKYIVWCEVLALWVKISKSGNILIYSTYYSCTHDIPHIWGDTPVEKRFMVPKPNLKPMLRHSPAA